MHPEASKFFHLHNNFRLFKDLNVKKKRRKKEEENLGDYMSNLSETNWEAMKEKWGPEKHFRTKIHESIDRWATWKIFVMKMLDKVNTCNVQWGLTNWQGNDNSTEKWA